MAFVVTESCIKCKYTDCVEVCPVDCFHEGPNMLVINPEECIDCSLCVPECPVDAIVAEDDLSGDQKEFAGLNEKYASLWPVIAEKKDAPADADQWKDRSSKLEHLET
ncbi:MAG: ferredoxin family protein [Gammaproteobacteria bacterium]|nr:ferredoxin family protein [Gammaproteobacteria bacterium]